MNSFAFVLVVVQAILIQNAYSQCCGRTIAAPVTLSSPLVSTVAQPSIAASLADTLSLLTVSSLLAESLPLNPNVIAAVPAFAPAYAPAYAPALSYGVRDCGCGCGCNGLGYGYNYFI